jgi:hypothetical protein
MKVKVDSFYNEMFDVTLELIVYRYSKQKHLDKVTKRLTSIDLDLSKTKDGLITSRAFCTSPLKGGVICIVFDVDSFKDKPTADKIVTLSHECAHFKNYILQGIGEEITKTDRESHLRISDWAFRKCMSTKFFKSLLK